MSRTVIASDQRERSNLAFKTRLPRRSFGPPRNDAAGTVYLVGAGPGDPGLITRRGAELLQQADCVIYDRLVGPELLKLTRQTCEQVYVGKESDEGGKSQSQINRLLIEKARRHRVVVRLKGGDPTLFGRIGEELEKLVKEKIPFEIVPGVSSAWAAAAAAGIPLTDRRYSSSVAIVTGQEAADKVRKVRWKALARGVDTLVILMGRSNLLKIVGFLRRAGRSGSTPMALIHGASTPNQQVWVSSLSKIEEDLKRHPSLTAPVVVVVGEVVKLAKPFRPQPLKGKRILLTRPESDQEGLTRRLQALGAACVSLPTIAIRPRFIPVALGKALLKELPRYDWILFTSHHGVETLDRLARRLGRSLPRLVKARICAIGPRTFNAVREAGLAADLVPSEFSTQGIQRAFRKISVKGRKILIPRSNLGLRDALAKRLRSAGARVDEVVLYETKIIQISPSRLRQALRGLDAATFTSASTVKGFFEALRQAKWSVRSALNGTAVVAIGPATAQALQEGGISKFHLPKGSWTVDGLVEAVREAVSS